VTPGDTTVQVRDDTGSVTATFETGVLDPRSMTAASFDLKNGQPFVITWSHPADFTDINFSPLLSFREVFAGTCENGCFGEQFSTFGSVTSPTQITFNPSFGQGAQMGEVSVQSNRTSGTVANCDALGCTFDLSHSAVVAASASF
jgi:hypothetical protein